MTESERISERDAVHRLLGDVIHNRKVATSKETSRIVECIAHAPFSDQLVNLPPEHQNRTYFGNKLGVRTDSLTVHLLKRIFINQQWSVETSPEEFLTDIRAAVLHESARLVVYERRGGIIVGVLSENITPSRRRGMSSLPLMYIVYSSDRGSIISAYQASNINTIAIPGDALWLR